MNWINFSSFNVGLWLFCLSYENSNQDTCYEKFRGGQAYLAHNFIPHLCGPVAFEPLAKQTVMAGKALWRVGLLMGPEKQREKRKELGSQYLFKKPLSDLTSFLWPPEVSAPPISTTGYWLSLTGVCTRWPVGLLLPFNVIIKISKVKLQYLMINYITYFMCGPRSSLHSVQPK